MGGGGEDSFGMFRAISNETRPRRMKFCMITTFYGSNSFGGDAAFVDRLSRRRWRGAVTKSTSFIVETPSKSFAAAKRLVLIKPCREWSSTSYRAVSARCRRWRLNKPASRFSSAGRSNGSLDRSIPMSFIFIIFLSSAVPVS